MHTSPGVISDKTQKDAVLKYVVKRGDSISSVIQKKYGASRGKIYKILGMVKRLNPGVKDLNKIYPGQIVMFPGTSPGDTLLPTGSGNVSAPIPEYKDVTIPEHKILSIVSHVINRMYGEVITEGSYCIPVPPSGEVKIDCSRVPVVEINDGNIILLDLSNRTPADLRRVIESTWENYRVVSAQKGEGISSILERVIDATGVYEVKKVNRYEQVGNTPIVKVLSSGLSRKNRSSKEQATMRLILSANLHSWCRFL